MKATTAAVVALVCALLAGCSDGTGDIDAAGHNGYDEMTCTDTKSLALDIQYGTVTMASGNKRLKQIDEEVAKASDPAIKQATAQLMQGFGAGNRQVVNAATVALVKACQL